MRRRTNGPPPLLSVRLHGGPGAPGAARRSLLSALQGQLAGDRQSDAAQSDAALVVSELVTNSVLHASVGADQTLTLEVTSLSDRLRITVADPGSRLDPRLQPHDLESAGGLGLFLVDKLAMAWGAERDDLGSTAVWCELALERAA
jgi:anti-sigma regulatory factor (Ser/Thr protein kinase)